MLLDFYQKKLDLFKELGELSQTMTEFTSDQLISDDEAGSDFLNFVDRRSVLIGTIDDLTREMTVLETNKTINEKSQDTALLRRALHQEMKKVLELNEIVESIVRNSLDQLREQARKLQDGKQSTRAYVGRVSSTEGSFFDKRR